MNGRNRLFLILGSSCLLTAVVAVGVTALSLFSRYMELEDLGHVLDEQTFSRIVGMTAADRNIVVTGAVLFAVGVLLIIAGLRRPNHRAL
ncbi:hypothetical protein ACIPVK_09395 [Paeniglutamicibacter sp. MACA_103]|uniref:hypothetical protein n=1 Tax=Paeniglutamicibacter sp. MACA_103 TaxID=3377337 RepID=UPI003894E550